VNSFRKISKVRNPPLILAIDDTPENLEILTVRLEANGYEVITATDGELGLAMTREHRPDLVLLDIMMPKLDGIAVVSALKQDVATRAIPVILVTAKADTRDVVAGLDAGGDDYLTKPFDHAALLARVRSMLRQKALHDTVEEQASHLERQASQLEAWNQSLERKVAEQVGEIERVSRLRRFLSAQVADLVMDAGQDASFLESHRCEVTVLFCDLRGFTAFAETAEPEEVMEILGDYHACLGRHIVKYEGTLERFLGDGVLVVFNDPLPCVDHTERAVRMATEMRDELEVLATSWLRHGHTLGFGIGIARGHATIGRIGFDQRWDYAVIGSVPNLASRLCGEATASQILVSQKVISAIENSVESVSIGSLNLKGLHRPVSAYQVIRWTE
jgi:adenylate cyclase